MQPNAVKSIIVTNFIDLSMRGKKNAGFNSHATLRIAISVLLLCGFSHSATMTWTHSGGDGLWGNAANWSGGAVPGSSDTVIFDATSTANCRLNSRTESGPIQMKSGYSGTLDLAGYTLKCQGLAAASGNILQGSDSLKIFGNTDLRGLTSFDPSTGTTYIFFDNSNKYFYFAKARFNRLVFHGNSTTIATKVLLYGDSLFIRENLEFLMNLGGRNYTFDFREGLIKYVDIGGSLLSRRFGVGTNSGGMRLLKNVFVVKGDTMDMPGDADFENNGSKLILSGSGTQTFLVPQDRFLDTLEIKGPGTVRLQTQGKNDSLRCRVL